MTTTGFYMGIIGVFYIIIIFTLTIVLLVSVVVLKNEKDIKKLREKHNFNINEKNEKNEVVK